MGGRERGKQEGEEEEGEGERRKRGRGDKEKVSRKERKHESVNSAVIHKHLQ